MHSILSIYFFWSPGFCFSSLHWGFSGTAFPPCSFGSLAFFFSSFGFVFSVSPFAPWPPSPESGFLSAPSCPLSVTSPDLPFLLPSFPSFPPCPSHCLRCPSLLAFLFCPGLLLLLQLLLALGCLCFRILRERLTGWAAGTIYWAVVDIRGSVQAT